MTDIPAGSDGSSQPGSEPADTGPDAAATGIEPMAPLADFNVPAEAASPVEVWFADPAPQARLTVLLRLILVIPQLVAVWALGVAADVVAIIGWFGALFTGRLPDFAADYLSRYLRWYARVAAYVLLLTGVYPPFSLEDADYPVRLAVRPGRLNRLAVFFRIILVIPVHIVAEVLFAGAGTIVMLITWLIVLIKGRMPRPLHEAYSAALRFGLRYGGYMYLLTSEYPKGLMGDPAPGGTFAAASVYTPGGTFAPAETAEQPAEVAEAPAETGDAVDAAEAPMVPADTVPADTVPADTVPEPVVATPAEVLDAPAVVPAGEPEPEPDVQAAATVADGTPVEAEIPAPAAPGEPPWPLVLSDGARKIMVGFLVVGVLVVAGSGVTIGVLAGSKVSKAAALKSVNSAHATLQSSLLSVESQAQSCTTSANPLHCYTGVDAKVSAAFDKFGTTIGSAGMPGGPAGADAATLSAQAEKVGHIYRLLAGATTATQYQSLARNYSLTEVYQVNTDYVRLKKDL